MMTVGIVNASYTSLNESINSLLTLINYKPERKKIFIKPNVLGPFSPDSGIITHPKAVMALVEILLDEGVEIVLGESSVVGTDTMTAFKKSGYFEIAKKYGVKLVDLNHVKRVKVPFKNHFIQVPEIIFSHEYINFPKMKTHNQAFVSISMKNQKGLLMGKDKKKFHRKGINTLVENICELSDSISPALNIVDAIDCLEGNGPGQWGIKKKMNLLLASRDIIAVDNVCIDIMGFRIDEVGYVPARKVKTVGLSVDQVRSSFLRPEFNRPKKMLNCYFWLGEACSGCSQNIRRALYSMWKRPDRAGRFLFLSLFKRMDIAAGGSAIKDGDLQSHILCVGDCSRKMAEEKGYRFIPGCPPKVDALIKKL
jgi:uncharacterized protein (DUF362 family)